MRPRSARIALILAGLFASAACSTSSARDGHGAALAVRQPMDQTIHRGTTNVVRVRVNRHNVAGPVAIRLENLPQGVSMLEANPRIASGEDDVAITLVADRGAAILTGHFVRVVAQGPDGATGAEGFRVSVCE